MTRRVLRNGIIWLAAGFLCSSMNSLLDRFAGAAPAANWARGFLDGLATVAFAAAIYFLVQQARLPSEGERSG